MPLGEQLAPHFARQVIDPRGPACSAARSTRRCSASPSRRCAASSPSSPAATSRTARSSCSTTRAARCSPGSARAALVVARREVDGVLARRQPGSTLKPFVYELAFEQRLITPAILLDDSPAQIATAARPVPAAELRPRLQGLGQRTHRARREPERAGGARRRDARRPMRCSSGCNALRPRPARERAASTATRSRSAAPT